MFINMFRAARNTFQVYCVCVSYTSYKELLVIDAVFVECMVCCVCVLHIRCGYVQCVIFLLDM